MTDYVDLVEYIVKNMVDHPDAVVVESHQGRARSQSIEISLDPEDVGRVIGKSGRNIEAIRAVVKAAAIKDRERVNVEVLADDLPPVRDAEGEDLASEAEDVYEAADSTSPDPGPDADEPAEGATEPPAGETAEAAGEPVLPPGEHEPSASNPAAAKDDAAE